MYKSPLPIKTLGVLLINTGVLSITPELIQIKIFISEASQLIRNILDLTIVK